MPGSPSLAADFVASRLSHCLAGMLGSGLLLVAQTSGVAAETAGAITVPDQLQLTADRQFQDSRNSVTVAEGNVRAQIGTAVLLADRIEFDSDFRTFHATGSVRLQRGRQLFQASRLRYNLALDEGELEDVYGVIDLEGMDPETSEQEPQTDPVTLSATSAEAIQPMACPPLLTPPPDWHPHPWAVTAWGGQMIDAAFGDTFLFNGRMRPEAVMGLSLQKRIFRAGPLAIEMEADLFSHIAKQQAGGEHNQSTPYAQLPAQSFGEGILGLGARVWLQPWLNVGFIEGISYNSSVSLYEKTFRTNYSQLLNYLGFEIEAAVSPDLSLVGRIHHRSGAFGTFNGVTEGSNAYLVGVRYRWGQDPAEPQQALMPPPEGCDIPEGATSIRPSSLSERLESITLGDGGTNPVHVHPTELDSTPTNVQSPAEQQAERTQQIAEIDQRVDDVAYRGSFSIERRSGIPVQRINSNVNDENRFGVVQVPQLKRLGKRQFLNGTISRWRVQASRVQFTADGWRADRMGFSNDPFTPSQTRIDAEDVVAREQDNGDLLISARRNRLIIEENLPIPVTRRQLIQKEDEVENRWVFGIDNKDRDGLFVGRNLRPVSIGAQTELSLEPQFMVQRAIDGGKDVGDLFGLDAKLGGRYGSYRLEAKAEIGSFDPDNLLGNSRFWGTFGRDIDLGAIGTVQANLFAAHRYRTWNGSLGESNIQSAYGAYAEQRGDWQQGQANHRYLVRGAVGNYTADHYRKDRLEEAGRATLFGSLTSRFPLISGDPAELTPQAAYRYSPEPIIPGLTLNTNINSSFAAYSTGTHQKTFSFSGGPTLTLGTFSRPFLDFTQLSVIGGGTLRGGGSPFEFDRAVDLGTLGFGITQQIVGPVLLSTGVNFNVDPGSRQYGDIINSNIEVRWQRRSYDLGVYFNPYEGIGGVRFRLNDFDFTGRGVPFVPYEPFYRQPRDQQLISPHHR